MRRLTLAWPSRRSSVAAQLAHLALLTLLGTTQAAAQAPDAALSARSLAATCSNCHGTDGQAVGVMPALAGMPADRMLALLAAFKSGATPATVMHQLTKGYSDDQLRSIASHFAAQKPRP